MNVDTASVALIHPVVVFLSEVSLTTGPLSVRETQLFRNPKLKSMLLCDLYVFSMYSHV